MGTETKQKNGAIVWRDDNNVIHREDGPAIIANDGTEMWIRNGKFHRRDGPAVIKADGRQEFYIDGNIMNITEFIEASDMNNSEKMYFMLKYGK